MHTIASRHASVRRCGSVAWHTVTSGSSVAASLRGTIATCLWGTVATCLWGTVATGLWCTVTVGSSHIVWERTKENRDECVLLASED
jgi:hypothetical protein